MAVMELDVTRYTCYRKCLKDFYEYKKSLRQSFSFRQFSARAGIKSPNYLQLVMQGERNLTDDTAPKVAKAMGLAGPARDYFLALVAKDRARSAEEKSVAEKHLYVAIKKLVSKEIPKIQSEILGKWYHLVIRELVFLPSFQPNGAWISRALRGLVSPAEAEDSWAFLVRSGFVVHRKGKFETADPVIDTGDAFGFHRVLQWHQQTMGMWIGLLTGLAQEERALGLLNVPVSSKRIPEIRDRMNKFREELIGLLQDEKHPDQVIQIGTYLLPVSLKL
ncbi:MAG: TIGR02147 family protein [Bdellovibrionales bacterium]|nr:TIGR02147 family protein [Bdellovibrionales bacterium]